MDLNVMRPRKWMSEGRRPRAWGKMSVIEMLHNKRHMLCSTVRSQLWKYSVYQKSCPLKTVAYIYAITFYCALLYGIGTLWIYHGLKATGFRYVQVFKHIRANLGLLGPCVLQDLLLALKVEGGGSTSTTLSCKIAHPFSIGERSRLLVGHTPSAQKFLTLSYNQPLHSSLITANFILLKKTLTCFEQCTYNRP